MPWDEVDPDDPQVLVGVALPGDAAAMHAMAAVFAEEFARLGYPEARILGLFDDPFYAGPHAARRALGAAAVRAIVAEAVAAWPVVRIVDREES
jgi:hypothetical protein